MRKFYRNLTSKIKNTIAKLRERIFKPTETNSLIIGRYNFDLLYQSHNEKSGFAYGVTIVDDPNNFYFKRFFHNIYINLSAQMSGKSVNKIHNFVKKETDPYLEKIHKIHYKDHYNTKIEDYYIEYKINDTWYSYNSETNEIEEITDEFTIAHLEDRYVETQMRIHSNSE